MAGLAVHDPRNRCSHARNPCSTCPESLFNFPESVFTFARNRCSRSSGIRRCMVRRMFRGSGAAIIALLGEPSCKVLRTEGTGVDGPISSRSKDVYVVVGREEYLLCHQDLERLRDHGYIYLSGSSQDSSFKLSRLGELFLSRYDNSPWLARGIRRVRHPSRFRCYGGRLLRCRCQKRVYPGFPTLFWGLSVFFVGDL